MLKRIALGVGLLWAVSAFGQPAASPTATPMLRGADLRADAVVLRRAYEQLHPGLYRYNTKAQMDAKFDVLEKVLSHDQTLEQAYVAFSVFAAQVKCGHTYANFFNQTNAVAGQLFRGQTRVPFYFVWIDGQMVVTEDFTPDHTLPRGTRVTSINGVAASAILAKLMTIARADGGNDAKRVASLGVSGDSVYETFDVFFPMFFPQTSTTMTLAVRRPGEARESVAKVEALTYEARIAPIKQREAQRKGGDAVLFEWKDLPDGSAYLRMPTWALYDSKWDWKSWLNGHLDALAGRAGPGLILDLRGNEGGQDVGNAILARLVPAGVPLNSLRRLVRYRKVPEDLVPYLDTWDPSFKDWGAAAVELSMPWPTAPPVNYFLLTRFDDDAGGDRIEPTGLRFTGKVFVLVDANNSSATFQFAQIVQQQKLGVLVGAPTGGSQRGINGGAFFFLRLPHSKIELDLPLIGTFPAAEMPDDGLTPDVLVRTTAEDIAAKKDPAMVAVMGMLGR